MKKYLQIIKDTWAEYMTYRLSFLLWRFRVVIQLLAVYFLWWAIFSEHPVLFGYSQSMILTYILLTSIARPFVMGTRTQEVGEIIVNGDLSNFLLRPIHFIRYYASRDVADKALNLFFAFFEFTIIFLLLRPPIFIQTNGLVLVGTIAALSLGMILFFYFSMIFSYLGFWTTDVWAPRFLSFVFAEFFTGALFPLDILPRPLYLLSQSLPFSYFIYFPLKVYLGQLRFVSVLQGMGIGVIWIIVLKGLLDVLWKKGLHSYTAQGR